MDEVRSGRIPFCKLDVLHRRNLELILPRFHRRARSARSERRNLNLAWHRLDAWPDVPPGLARLKRRYLLAPVSNGNISLMVDLARRNNLPWDAILGSEIAGDYKPKPRVYLAAAEAFDLAAARLHDGGRAHERSDGRRRAWRCAPATSRARTSTAPAAARLRRESRSTSPRAVSRIWPRSLGREVFPLPLVGRGWGGGYGRLL